MLYFRDSEMYILHVKQSHTRLLWQMLQYDTRISSIICESATELYLGEEKNAKIESPTCVANVPL